MDCPQCGIKDCKQGELCKKERKEAPFVTGQYFKTVRCRGVDEDEDDDETPCNAVVSINECDTYCEECGLKIEKEWFKIPIPLCKGKSGQLCGAELKEDKKHCKNCGAKNPHFIKKGKGINSGATPALPDDSIKRDSHSSSKHEQHLKQTENISSSVELSSLENKHSVHVSTPISSLDGYGKSKVAESSEHEDDTKDDAGPNVSQDAHGDYQLSSENRPSSTAECGSPDENRNQISNDVKTTKEQPEHTENCSETIASAIPVSDCLRCNETEGTQSIPNDSVKRDSLSKLDQYEKPKENFPSRVQLPSVENKRSVHDSYSASKASNNTKHTHADDTNDDECSNCFQDSHEDGHSSNDQSCNDAEGFDTKLNRGKDIGRTEDEHIDNHDTCNDNTNTKDENSDNDKQSLTQSNKTESETGTKICPESHESDNKWSERDAVNVKKSNVCTNGTTDKTSNQYLGVDNLVEHKEGDKSKSTLEPPVKSSNGKQSDLQKAVHEKTAEKYNNESTPQLKDQIKQLPKENTKQNNTGQSSNSCPVLTAAKSGKTEVHRNTTHTTNIKKDEGPKRADFCEVVFHVLVPEEFQLDDDKHVVVRFQNKFMMDKSTDKNGIPMSKKCKRTIKDKDGQYSYWAVEINIKIPKAKLPKLMTYKYGIVYKNGSGEEQWEYLPAKSLRSFQYNEGLENIYDGFVIHNSSLNKTDSTFWNKFTSYVGLSKQTISINDRLQAYCRLGLEEFIPTAKQLAKWPSETYKKATDIINCLYSAYLIWNSKAHQARTDFDATVTEVLCNRLQLCNKLDVEKKQEGEERLAFALLTALVCENRHLEEHQCQILFNAVLIRPDLKQKRCHDYDGLMKLFKSQDKLLDNAFRCLRNICQNACANFSDPCWLYCLPLFHFHFFNIQPFTSDTERSENWHKTASWWGIDEQFNQSINNFKRHTDWLTPINDVLSTLEPLFEADYLLERSFVASLNFQKTKTCITMGKLKENTIFANIYFFVCTMHRLDPKDFINVLQQIRKMIKAKEPFRNAREVNMYLDVHLICQDIDKELSKQNVQTTVLVEFYKCMYVVTAKLTGHSDKFDQIICRYLNWTEIENESMEVIRFLRKAFPPSCHENVKIWDGMFDLDLPPVVEEYMFERTTEGFKHSLMETSNEVRIGIYFQYADSYSPNVQTCVNQVVLKDIDSTLKILGNRTSSSFQNWTAEGKEKYKRLLSKKFNEKWVEFDDTSGLRICLEWAPCQSYLKTLDSLEDVFDRYCQDRLHIAKASLSEQKLRLENGNITTDVFKYLCKYKDIFCELMSPSEEERRQLSLCFQHREDQISKLDRQSTAVELLLTMFNAINKEVRPRKVKTNDIEKKFEAIKKKDNNLRFTDFCDASTNSTYIHYYSFSQKMDIVIERILNRQTSWIFKQMCNKLGKQYFKLQRECKPFESASVEMLEKVEPQWDSFKTEVSDKSITIDKAIMHIHLDMETDKMISELKHMELPHLTAVEFADALTNYKKVQRANKVAKAFVSVKEMYGLSGQFELVNRIAEEPVSSDVQLSEYSGSCCIEIPDEILNITDQMCKSITAFSSSHAMVNWIKANAGGKDTWRVFVDLSSIHSGESAEDMARIRCFDAAVTGYTPLIFDLEDHFGYEEVYQLFSLVWKFLEKDTELPEKLKDVSNNHNWYEHIKKTFGSDEVTSMAQAKDINEAGVYCVGYLSNTKLRIEDKGEFDLDNILRLTIPHDDESCIQYYTYEELQNLQSRLMLVAGNEKSGKEENKTVDKYIQVFDSVVRLANVYKTLCSTGCVLFRNWKARILSNPFRPKCVFLEFGSDTDELGWESEGDKDVSYVTPKLAKFMENCLEKWRKYIDSERSSCGFLNYFTMDQLVILQRELVNVSINEEPSSTVYPLLSYVKPDCDKSDIIEAMKLAMESLKEARIAEAPKLLAYSSDNTHETLDTEIATRKIVNDVIDAGFSETSALKAIEAVGIADEMTILEWVNENDERIREEEEKEKEFKGWCESAISTSEFGSQSITLGKDVNPTEEDLDELWNMFINSFESTVKDFISLRHLGGILECLSTLNKMVIQRNIHLPLQEGVPNLIICPGENIIRTMLGIYMADPEEPLPLPEEVLVCMQTTTLDQVDIFIRRALFGSIKHIFCLIEPETLQFTVDDTCERYLEKYLRTSKDKGIKYRLVVVSNSTSQKQSRIVAALERYNRQGPIESYESIRKYIKDKLSVPNSDTSDTDKIAAAVDQERCCVRLIKSAKSGLGKTLLTQRITENFSQRTQKSTDEISTIIPLQESDIDVYEVTEKLLKHIRKPDDHSVRIFRIDISTMVETGIDFLLLNLCVLGCLMDREGHIWRRGNRDLYLIETTMKKSLQKSSGEHSRQMLQLLPDTWCKAPEECMNSQNHSDGQVFDIQESKSETFQMPIQYLAGLDQGILGKKVVVDNPEDSLKILLRHCGIKHPSWAELTQFVKFLSTQLKDFENSYFCSRAAATDLPGFAAFVLKFLIQMSKDFSTRSLKISEETEEESDIDGVDDVEQYSMKRTWESSPHPYIFFNPDHVTMTFLGFSINTLTMDLEDSRTGSVLEKAIMTLNLFRCLKLNGVPVNENFDQLSRKDKLERICKVMGNEKCNDPDDTYELTADNAKKILAIYMRIRCGIPVVVMGETGSGKTRLVSFMCQLQIPLNKGKYINKKENKSKNDEAENDIQQTIVEDEEGDNTQDLDEKQPTCMIISKIHGGTRPSDIIKKVKRAEQLAEENAAQFGDKIYTVLFLDEANSTDCIGLIKEIMCDRCIQGKPIRMSNNLRLVAACNPYKKHSDDLIKRMEEAGLGYHVDSDKVTDRCAGTPMRKLVYRVKRLPQSLIPLVWDFGQLDSLTEKLYIKQMVRRYVLKGRLPNIANFIEVATDILSESQDFMRKQKDECSFVSLRDVDRTLTVMEWFYKVSKDEENPLFAEMNKRLEEKEVEYQSLANPENNDDSDESEEDEDETNEDHKKFKLNIHTRCLVLAIGVCYDSCLRSRSAYRQHISQYFKQPCSLPGKDVQFEYELKACQEVFLDDVKLDNNIARNNALRENVFMMVICIELRIPLFLIGKPGSSKSLAKTIVTDVMRGMPSEQGIFSKLKQVQMVSYQCSPQSTADGIIALFRQCARFQEDKQDLNRYTAVVVLDEVGLAEDSPKMPLKSLHALLETGYQEDDVNQIIQPKAKVGFIGISNWALDPAKMNRGIMVQRDLPDLQELEESARGICAASPSYVDNLFGPLARAYNDIVGTTLIKREFFGLRDFYSLIKMVQAFAEENKEVPTHSQMKHAVLRNFGGIDTMDPYEIFSPFVDEYLRDTSVSSNEPDCSPAGMIKQSLRTSGVAKGQSRYLLLLTENLSMVNLLQQRIFTLDSAITIYGSSFPSDLDFTQVCRNINKIKICMETGTTVILLNLENIYESLYDALNQYYSYLGMDRFVDIGLGSHRTKCKVHKNFRLIVVSEKKTVYEKYPIPLINRLEKHFIKIETLLQPEQIKVSERLQTWASSFCKQKQSVGRTSSLALNDVFRGYHVDTCAAITLYLWEDGEHNEVKENKVLENGKKMLLWCATPESIVRTKTCELPKDEITNVWRIYWEEQAHTSISEYILFHEHDTRSIFSQVTTHSKLLSTSDKVDLCLKTRIKFEYLFLESLESFDTEQQFNIKVRSHIEKCREHEERSMLIVMCEYNHANTNLIACARNCLLDEYVKHAKNLREFNVIFLVRLPRDGSTEGPKAFVGFQCGHWQSVHIDNVRDSEVPPIHTMANKTIGEMLKSCISSSNDAEQDQNRVDITKGTDSFTRNLLLHCIPFVMAKVEDLQTGSERSLKMIDVLQCHLNDNDKNGNQLTFTNCLSGLLATILVAEEEQFCNRDDLQKWVHKVSITTDVILQAGTFGDACVKYIQNRLTPLLAGTIAYIDRNQNLDTLSRDDQTWKHNFWLDILSSHNVLDLHTRAMLDKTSTDGENEVVVKTSGFEGNTFKTKLPFSWLIFEIIVDNTGNDITDGYEGTIAHEAALRNTELGKIILKFDTPATEVEFISSYIEDVLKMITTSSCQSETEVLNYIVFEEVRQKFAGKTKTSILHKILLVHETIGKLQATFVILRSAGEIFERAKDNKSEPGQQENEECALFYDKWKKKVKVDTSSGYSGIDNIMLKFLELILARMVPDKLDKLNLRDGQKKILGQIYKSRQIVEEIFSKYGSIPEIVKSCKTTWYVLVIVKLFLEHVHLSNTIEGPISKACGTLWLYLKEKSDMKNLPGIKALEAFLRMCNQNVLKSLFGTFDKCECCSKERKNIESMIPLACEHFLCSDCFREIKSTGMGNKCQKCKKEIDLTYDPNASDSFGVEKMKQQKNFQRKCNLFYMDVITQMCFSGERPPTDEVIKHLLLLITGNRTTDSVTSNVRITQKLTVFIDSVDATPVFRSFILKLLVRSCKEKVVEHLKGYIQNASEIITSCSEENSTTILQLYVMVIQCFEDVLFEESILRKTVNEVQHATRCLWGVTLAGDETTMNLLCDLAKIKYALCVLAKYIHTGIPVEDTHYGVKISDIYHLVSTVVNIFKDGNDMPRIYLMKQIYGTFGFQSLYLFDISSDTYICQLHPQNEQQEKKSCACPDRYAIFGEEYVFYREAIYQVLKCNDKSKMEGLTCADSSSSVLLSLAIHREITLNTHKEESEEAAVVQIGSYLEDNQILTDLQRRLLSNNLSHLNSLLHVTTKLDPEMEDIHCLIIHCFCVFTVLKKQNSILQPFLDLKERPQEYKESFLPTMPEIDMHLIADLKKIIDEADNNTFYNAKDHQLYSCPNGHPYMVGNCGKAFEGSKCAECGEAIGGESMHVLLDTNTKGVVRREIGHILDTADNAQLEPVREIAAANIGLLRLLTHIALYIGSTANETDVQYIIKTNTTKTEAKTDIDVKSFLCDHIKHDIHCIGKTLGRNEDDVFIVMHTFVQGFLGNCQLDYEWPNDDVRMKNADTRNEWERAISERLIQPIMSDLDNIVQTGIQKIGQDKRFASDTLDLVLEIKNDDTKGDGKRLQDMPQIWQYKSRISIADMRNKFFATAPDSVDKMPVLAEFLQKEHLLRAVKFVPSIKRLQKLLLQMYSKNLDRKKAERTTVADLYSEDATAKHKYLGLLNDFASAWDICRDCLLKYVCRTKYGPVKLSKELCNSRITEQTKLTMLLPSQNGDGLCSFSLLQFLLSRHNDMIEFHRSKNRGESSMAISMNHVTASDLVMFDSESDLFPLVLANCQYSFEIGKGTVVEYDFVNIERQIKERYLNSKPTIRIAIRDLKLADEMLYRFDTTNALSLKALESLIKQDHIEDSIKKQIEQEFRCLSDICRTIDNLNIAIKFLKSLGAKDADELLVSFMQNTLKLQNPLSNNRASQYCSLRHIKALWLLLSRRKAMENEQLNHSLRDVFDGVAKVGIFETIDDSDKNALTEFCVNISLESLESLAEIIFECIAMRFSVQENPDDTHYVEYGKYSLLETIRNDEDLDIEVRAPHLTKALEKFPSAIICSQSGMVCMIAFRYINDENAEGLRFR